MKNKLRIVGIQADLAWENPKKNLAFFESEISKLSNKTDLVILPEMFTTGFTMNAKKVAETTKDNSVEWIKSIAKKYNIAITGSLVIREKNKYYNRLLFVHTSGKIEIYNKRHLFTLAGEERVYSSGEKKVIIDFKGWKICPLICYDLRFPVWARNKENYDLLIYVANWPVTRIEAWNTLLKARATENMSYTIGVNRVGKDANGYEYSGNSLIIDYLGNKLSSLKKGKIGIVQAKLKKKNQNEVRKKLSFLNDRDNFTIQ